MFYFISFYLSSNKNLFNKIDNYNTSPQYRACNNQQKKKKKFQSNENYNTSQQ